MGLYGNVTFLNEKSQFLLKSQLRPDIEIPAGFNADATPVGGEMVGITHVGQVINSTKKLKINSPELKLG